MAPATFPSTASSDQQERHKSGGRVPTTVAKTILKRHVANRQRFDSADYAMIHSATVATTAPQPQPQPLRASHSAGCSPRAPDEHESEPDALGLHHQHHEQLLTPQPYKVTTGNMPQQQVCRIRLQRFDSADWVMDATTRAKRSPRASGSGASASAADTGVFSAHSNAVATLLLERHAYTTCHFVTTPVEETHQSVVG